MKPPAIILLGGMVATWNHRFVRAARRRGLAVAARRRAATTASPGRSRTEPSRRPGASSQGVADCVDRAGQTWPGDVDRVLSRGRSGTTSVASAACARTTSRRPASWPTCSGLPAPGLRAGAGLPQQVPAAALPRGRGARARGSSRRPPRRRRRRLDRFPAVVKPVGRSASSGVRLVADPGRAVALRSPTYPPGETLLLEERVVGPEYSVESLSRNGQCLYVEVTEKRTTEGDSPYFVELGHTTPAVNLTEAARAGACWPRTPPCSTACSSAPAWPTASTG